MTINRIKFGPLKSERDFQLAFSELERKLNEIIREINSLKETIENANPNT